MNRSLGCCGKDLDEVSGYVSSFVKVGVSLSKKTQQVVQKLPNFVGKIEVNYPYSGQAQITLTGPSDVWFGVGLSYT